MRNFIFETPLLRGKGRAISAHTLDLPCIYSRVSAAAFNALCMYKRSHVMFYLFYLGTVPVSHSLGSLGRSRYGVITPYVFPT